MRAGWIVDLPYVMRARPASSAAPPSWFTAPRPRDVVEELWIRRAPAATQRGWVPSDFVQHHPARRSLRRGPTCQRAGLLGGVGPSTVASAIWCGRDPLVTAERAIGVRR